MTETEWRRKPVVEIEWVDSNVYGGWDTHDRADNYPDEGGLACLTTGYLLRETDETVTVVQSLSTVDAAGAFLTIPVCAIRATRTLRSAEND